MEKITPEFLKQIGFKQCKPCHVWGTPNSNWWHEESEIEIWEFNDSGDYLWIEYDSLPMRYCEDLLALMRWIERCSANRAER